MDSGSRSGSSLSAIHQLAVLNRRSAGDLSDRVAEHIGAVPIIGSPVHLLDAAVQVLHADLVTRRSWKALCMTGAAMGLGAGRNCRAVGPMRPAGCGIRVESRNVDRPWRDHTMTRNLRDELRVPKARPRLYLARYQALAQPTRRAHDL